MPNLPVFVPNTIVSPSDGQGVAQVTVPSVSPIGHKFIDGGAEAEEAASIQIVRAFWSIVDSTTAKK